jgi:hypothetical protein
MLDSGAATRNGMPARRAARARPNVPILFATSALAAIRSAPTSSLTADTHHDEIPAIFMMMLLTLLWKGWQDGVAERGVAATHAARPAQAITV